MFSGKVESNVVLLSLQFVGLLFTFLLRLDQSIGKPKSQKSLGNPLSGWDERGKPICIEPDGKVFLSNRLTMPVPLNPLSHPPARRVYWEIESE